MSEGKLKIGQDVAGVAAQSLDGFHDHPAASVLDGKHAAINFSLMQGRQNIDRGIAVLEPVIHNFV